MSCRSVLSVFIVLLVIALPCAGQDSWNIELIKSFPMDMGNLGAIRIQNDYILGTTTNAGLVAYSINDPEYPALVNECHDINMVYGLVAVENIAILYNRWGNEIHLIDVTDINDIHRFGVININESIVACNAKDNILYVTTREGLSSYDISDPDDPEFLNTLETNFYLSWIALNNSYLFSIGGGNTLMIFDISVPDSISLIGTHEFFDEIRTLTVDNEYAYIVGNYWDTGRHRLFIIDISDPENPDEKYRTQGFEMMSSVHIMDDVLFLISSMGGRLYTMDVSDREHPDMLTCFQSNGLILGLDTRDHYVYLGNHQDGLNILDISNPEDPVSVGGFDTSPINELAIKDSILYAVGDGKLSLLNTNQMQRCGLTNTLGKANSIDIQGNFAFIADGDSGVSVFDLSDPVNLEIISALETEGCAEKIITEGNYAYLADGTGGFLVIDISDPESIEIVSQYSDIGYAEDFYINNNYAFVTSDNQGVFIIDITEPENISFIEMIESDQRDLTVCATEDFLYFGNYSGVLIYDIADITGIHQVGFINRYCWHLEITYPYLMFSNTGSLYIRDVTLPNNSVKTGFSSLATRYFTRRDEYIYATDGDFIHILDISDALSIDDPEPPTPTSPSLVSAYPNPFNSQTRLSYTLTTPEKVSVSVVSLDGRIIKEHNIGALNEGEHSLTLDASGWATGIYLVRMKAGYVTMTAKLVCLK